MVLTHKNRLISTIPTTFFHSIVMGIISFMWASIYWLGNSNLSQDLVLTSTEYLKRPWVYRQLVPWLARLLSLTGLRIDLALTLLVTMCGVGFYLSLRAVYKEYYFVSNYAEIGLLVASILGMIIFYYNRMPYDLMTAFLMTLCLLFLSKEDYPKFLLVFIFATLNRETSLLLLPLVFLQFGFLETFFAGFVYVELSVWIRFMFMGNPGSLIWINPIQNLQALFSGQIYWTLILLILLIALAFKNFIHRPKFFRWGFGILLPLSIVAYLVCGQVEEIRVFWEVYPVIVMLGLPSVLETI